MSRFWSGWVRQLKPYVPGEQPKLSQLVKLNTNENPYPPSPSVLAALSVGEDATDAGADIVDALRRYPDPQSLALREAVAAYSNLTPEQVFVGNGSDEVLALAFMALLRQVAPVCLPDISYSFYPVWCQFGGIEYVEVPLEDDFSLDVNRFPARNGGIVFANPNAPTGCCLTLEAIANLLRSHSDSLVIVDEAYIAFGGESATALISDFDNLLVVQTLSKSHALAGLRVGFALGHADLIEALVRAKDSFNSYPVDALAQRLACAALTDTAYLQETCAKIIASRESLRAGLEVLGFRVLPSQANFLFTTHPERSASDLFTALRERGVLVRHFSGARIEAYLRITVGTEEQCAALLAALKGIIEGG